MHRTDAKSRAGSKELRMCLEFGVSAMKADMDDEGSDQSSVINETDAVQIAGKNSRDSYRTLEMKGYGSHSCK